MRLKEFLKTGGETNYDENWNKLPMDRKINYVKGFLTQRGYTPNQTAAILGNLLQENSTLGTSVANSQSKALGIAQWLGSRKTELLQNQNPYSIITQLNHLDSELKGSKHWTNNIGGKKEFFQNDNVEALTKIIRKDFERPGEAEAHDDKRIKNAYKILGQEYIPSQDQSDQYFQNIKPDMSRYSQMFQDMQKGLNFDFNQLNQAYNEAPDFTKLMMENVNIGRDFQEKQRLDQERLQQEENKKQLESENQQFQIALQQKELEKQRILDMVPQSQSVASGNIKPSLN